MRKVLVHPGPPPSGGRRARAGVPPHAIRGAGNNGAMNRIRPSSFLNGPGVRYGAGRSSARPERARRDRTDKAGGSDSIRISRRSAQGGRTRAAPPPRGDPRRCAEAQGSSCRGVRLGRQRRGSPGQCRTEAPARGPCHRPADGSARRRQGVLTLGSVMSMAAAGSPGGLRDQLCDLVRVGDQRQVAGIDLDRGGVHAVGKEALKLGRRRAILPGDGIPGRL